MYKDNMKQECIVVKFYLLPVTTLCSVLWLITALLFQEAAAQNRHLQKLLNVVLSSSLFLIAKFLEILNLEEYQGTPIALILVIIGLALSLAVILRRDHREEDGNWQNTISSSVTNILKNTLERKNGEVLTTVVFGYFSMSY
jgi:uncharacterized membrane protein